MKIWTYYSEVPGISAYDSLRLITKWRERWQTIGFEPFVLGEYQAEQHPYFKEFDASIRKLPTQNAAEYERACYLRWLALAQVGGGLMSDYDVFPRQKVPADFVDENLGKLQLMQSNCVCPCLFYASKEVAERVCREFVTRKFKMHEINGKPHLSDQYALEQVVESGAGWIIQKDLTMLWGEDGWDTRPFVHFANRISQSTGKSPRWQFVDEMLK